MSEQMYKDLIKKAQRAYYNGRPIMSDEAYDLLVQNYGDPDTIGPKGKVKLPVPMYSLKTIYKGEKEPQLDDPIKTPKVDGTAVCLEYANQKLQRAYTRGDGSFGQDITTNINACARYNALPLNIGYEYLIVMGEFVVTSPVHENLRNIASGLLNLKDLNVLEDRITNDYNVFFIVYDSFGFNAKTYEQKLTKLLEWGFTTVLGVDKNAKIPTDGVVYRENDEKTFKSLGYTSKYPRGAYALKDKPKSQITTLNDVEWQVGRTGKVTPVAHLEPVTLDDGSTISRATLNNVNYIEELDLEIGCLVRIERAGEIIPRILERVD